MFVRIPDANRAHASPGCDPDRCSNCGADPGAHSENGSDTNP